MGCYWTIKNCIRKSNLNSLVLYISINWIILSICDFLNEFQYLEDQNGGFIQPMTSIYSYVGTVNIYMVFFKTNQLYSKLYQSFQLDFLWIIYLSFILPLFHILDSLVLNVIGSILIFSSMIFTIIQISRILMNLSQLYSKFNLKTIMELDLFSNLNSCLTISIISYSHLIKDLDWSRSLGMELELVWFVAFLSLRMIELMMVLNYFCQSFVESRDI
ncbi:hypothetical protein BC833DRAFT_586638 [Globomyces pollinis-pini]|nr:hypothetical protein BC833DRAFT_586638 [Globomyces pollinis-pini]